MSALKNKTGPYYYADEAISDKVFDFGRTFKILISGAYDAGIVGPEHNGIVILDDDNRAVVLDQHFRESSGYFGPSHRQLAEFERIKAMGWGEFSKFCHSHARYRKGASPDIDTLSGPDTGNPLQRAIAAGKPTGAPGRSILTPEMEQANADPEVPYQFEHKTRDDITVFLARHHGHVPMNHNNGGFVLAWNIKVHGRYDATGKNNGDAEVDPEFDEKWEEYTEDNDIFGQACSDALFPYLHGEYSTYPGADQGEYKFSTNGRSGGHLILQDWNGPKPPGGGWAMCPMAFENRSEFIAWLQELPDDDLARLYKLAVCVDHDTQNPEEEISHQIASIREGMEDLWRAEATPASR